MATFCMGGSSPGTRIRRHRIHRQELRRHFEPNDVRDYLREASAEPPDRTCNRRRYSSSLISPRANRCVWATPRLTRQGARDPYRLRLAAPMPRAWHGGWGMALMIIGNLNLLGLERLAVEQARSEMGRHAGCPVVAMPSPDHDHSVGTAQEEQSAQRDAAVAPETGPPREWLAEAGHRAVRQWWPG